MKKVTHLLEMINIFNPKMQGRMFEVSSPENFAKMRCEELNSTELAKEFNHDYQFVINPKETKAIPTELYKTSSISIEQGVEPVRIVIYRKFKN
jgi:hypothetical protein